MFRATTQNNLNQDGHKTHHNSKFVLTHIFLFFFVFLRVPSWMKKNAA